MFNLDPLEYSNIFSLINDLATHVVDSRYYQLLTYKNIRLHNDVRQICKILAPKFLSIIYGIVYVYSLVRKLSTLAHTLVTFEFPTTCKTLLSSNSIDLQNFVVQGLLKQIT